MTWVDPEWEAKFLLMAARMNDEEYDEYCFGHSTRTPHPRGKGSTKYVSLDDVLFDKDPGRYMCTCPMHEDDQASLSVLITDEGKILVNCFAGCDWREVQDYVKEHS